MNITLCQANGDQDRFEDLRSELLSMGYPICTRERMHQIPCSNEVLQPGTARMGRIENSLINSPSDLVFFDNEFPNHAAYREPNTNQQRAARDHLVHFSRQHGKKCGFWGEPSVWSHSREPISAISITNVLRHRHRPDHVIGNGYLRQHLESMEDAVTYAMNLSYWAHIADEALHSDRTRSSIRLFMAFQQFMRPAGTWRRFDISSREAFILGRALRALPCDVLWWFELEHSGDDEKTLEEAARLAGPFNDGFNSIGTYGVHADAGRPQGRGD